MQLKQLQMAKFEYEVRDENLNLYDRIDRKKGKNTLRFLAQVPFKGELETAVKEAVGVVYSKITAPANLRIQAIDLRCGREVIDYIK